MQNVNDYSPEILFHYTSIEVLTKIIDSVEDKICFFATHAMYLNDPTEYCNAISLLEESMKKFETDNKIQNKQSYNFKHHLFSDMSLMFGEPYLLSFSENDDDLAMWRSYGSDGRGVAIGLDRTKLQKYSRDESNENTDLIKCLYEKDDIMNGLIKFWSKNYDQISISDDGKSIGLNNFDLFFNLTQFCFSFKSHAYTIEKEWRLCKTDADSSSSSNKNIHYRERNGLIVPYLRHHFSKDIIKKIVIGPCVNREMLKKSILMLLDSRGFNLKEKDILISDVPYRMP
jgi:hypothetical protein